MHSRCWMMGRVQTVGRRQPCEERAPDVLLQRTWGLNFSRKRSCLDFHACSSLVVAHTRAADAPKFVPRSYAAG